MHAFMMVQVALTHFHRMQQRLFFTPSGSESKLDYLLDCCAIGTQTQEIKNDAFDKKKNAREKIEARLN